MIDPQTVKYRSTKEGKNKLIGATRTKFQTDQQNRLGSEIPRVQTVKNIAQTTTKVENCLDCLSVKDREKRKTRNREMITKEEIS